MASQLTIPAGPPPEIDLSKYESVVSRLDTVRANGLVSQVIGLVVESIGPTVQVGEICEIRHGGRNAPVIKAEVVGFKANRVLLMPLGEMEGIKPGSEVVATGHTQHTIVGDHLLGRILDGLGEPADGKGSLAAHGARHYPINCAPPNALTRKRITEPIQLGIRAIDGLLTLGKGQRMGIFAGSGVGKSTVMGMIARNTTADINVICLVGERGREVREFVESDLGPEGLARSVLVIATSDQPPLVRLKAPFIATTIAEYFRDRGKDVMLMMDSVTRFAMAQREVGLAVGEPPATRGYTPSVFAILPKLLERAGASDKGTITALYTVLVEGDDENEPIADTVRGILDGHIWLSRDLAARNHYPAIEVSRSVSRVMPQVTEPEQRKAAGQLREMMSTYREAEDLINIGAYAEGSNPRIDASRRMIEPIRAFLRQGVHEKNSFDETVAALEGMFENEEL
ncbi:MAG: flagellar protein export ATPase FliI [Capsulimonas sp.]|uniref:flagellar protein export ATPase FliI n=1 Tax=Capsulimonas sp. TaxID=2494211 RepID=UPI003266EA9E